MTAKKFVKAIYPDAWYRGDIGGEDMYEAIEILDAKGHAGRRFIGWSRDTNSAKGTWIRARKEIEDEMFKKLES